MRVGIIAREFGREPLIVIAEKPHPGPEGSRAADGDKAHRTEWHREAGEPRNDRFSRPGAARDGEQGEVVNIERIEWRGECIEDGVERWDGAALKRVGESVTGGGIVEFKEEAILRRNGQPIGEDGIVLGEIGMDLSGDGRDGGEVGAGEGAPDVHVVGDGTELRE